jgi:hypothetical protein
MISLDHYPFNPELLVGTFAKYICECELCTEFTGKTVIISRFNDGKIYVDSLAGKTGFSLPESEFRLLLVEV